MLFARLFSDNHDSCIMKKDITGGGFRVTEKSKSLIGGISILGLAGMICKVVGVLYRIPLADSIGGDGLGVYSKVFSAYNMLLTIASVGIPVAISRIYWD